jgi:hypothetical protein
MKSELSTTYNPTPILDEYDNHNIKKIDEVLAAIPQSEFTKFNFAPTTKTDKPNIQKLFISLGTSLLILCLCLGFFMMPLISGATEILPINPNPSNEKLTVTSKRSSFFVQYNNNIYYSVNQNGVWTLDLGKITGNDKLKVGTYIDFGLFKLNSSKTEEFSFNRNYEVSNITTDIKKYMNMAKGEYNLNINSPEKYFKVTNGDKIVYETGENQNVCKSKIENKATILTCGYDFGVDKKELNFDLKIQDEFGNIKAIDPIKSVLVPVNDFSCNTKSIYSTSKISCLGNKNGKIIINNSQIVEYIANKKMDLPIPIQEGDNKIALKMVDEHGFENTINLEFLFDKTPLNIAIKTDEDNVIINSNKDNTTIDVKASIDIANIITGKRRAKDITDRIKLVTTTANKAIDTIIINSEIKISKEEYFNLKALEKFKEGSIIFDFEDSRGKTSSKTCELKPQEIDKKYLLKVIC